jgi:hypothetical protein
MEQQLEQSRPLAGKFFSREITNVYAAPRAFPQPGAGNL